MENKKDENTVRYTNLVENPQVSKVFIYDSWTKLGAQTYSTKTPSSITRVVLLDPDVSFDDEELGPSRRVL